MCYSMCCAIPIFFAVEQVVMFEKKYYPGDTKESVYISCVFVMLLHYFNDFQL